MQWKDLYRGGGVNQQFELGFFCPNLNRLRNLRKSPDSRFHGSCVPAESCVVSTCRPVLEWLYTFSD